MYCIPYIRGIFQPTFAVIQFVSPLKKTHHLAFNVIYLSSLDALVSMNFTDNMWVTLFVIFRTCCECRCLPMEHFKWLHVKSSCVSTHTCPAHCLPTQYFSSLARGYSRSCFLFVGNTEEDINISG